VFIDHFEASYSNKLIRFSNIQDFVHTWSRFDRQAQGFIDKRDFIDFVGSLSPPLGIVPEELRKLKKVAGLGIQITADGRVALSDCFLGLVREAYKHKIRTRWQTHLDSVFEANNAKEEVEEEEEEKQPTSPTLLSSSSSSSLAPQQPQSFLNFSRSASGSSSLSLGGGSGDSGGSGGGEGSAGGAVSWSGFRGRRRLNRGLQRALRAASEGVADEGCRDETLHALVPPEVAWRLMRAHKRSAALVGTGTDFTEFPAGAKIQGLVRSFVQRRRLRKLLRLVRAVTVLQRGIRRMKARMDARKEIEQRQRQLLEAGEEKEEDVDAGEGAVGAAVGVEGGGSAARREEARLVVQSIDDEVDEGVEVG
jgi:hypothetical protein